MFHNYRKLRFNEGPYLPVGFFYRVMPKCMAALIYCIMVAVFFNFRRIGGRSYRVMDVN